jgi:DNA (cytosine-5)-methyltransferase 1
LAFDRAGMECVYQCELERSCVEIIRRHWPQVKRTRDVCNRRTARKLIRERPELIAFGFPCQDLSVAGLRAGLDGKRSSLFFACRALVALCRPSRVVIENVPGLLSSNCGRDMGIVLSSLGQLGYGWAYRVLDAQWFGLAQRRKRVFIVGCLGSRRRAAEILFEREGVLWNSPPSRKAWARVAGTVSGGAHPGGHNGQDDMSVVATLNSGDHEGGFRTEPGEHLIAFQCHGSNVGPMGTVRSGNGNETGGVPFVVTPIHEPSAAKGANGAGIGNEYDPMFTLEAQQQHAIAFKWSASHTSRSAGLSDDLTPPIESEKQPAIAFQTRIGRNGRGQPKPITDALTSCAAGTHADSKPHVAGSFGVRRLTPRECERLQGFPDGWTEQDASGKKLSDSARYRMLGNAVAVPVAEWIGRRLLTCE